MTLRSQILALIAIPLVALIGLGSMKGFNDWERLSNAQVTQVSVDASLGLITLVHHLQVERGQSAAFLSSGGKNFAQELPATRALVDQTIAGISAEDRTILSKLGELSAFRSRVADKDLTVFEMATFYTGAISDALNVVGKQLIAQQNADLAQIGAGLVALSYAKEAAGLQRAAGAAGFGKGTFSLPIYEKFAATGANEARLLALSNLSLQPHVPELDLATALQKTGLQDIRQAVSETGPGGELPALTAPEWFKLSTTWISHLRGVEDRVAAKMKELATEEAGNASQSLWITSIGVAVAIVLSALIGLRLILAFTKQFGSLQKDLDRLSRKEFDFEPTNLHSKNEVGQLSQAMEVTRVALYDAEKNLAKMEQNRIADRGAVVGKLDQHLSQLAARDLDCEIPEAFPEEYEALRSSFNSTVEILKKTMTEVMSATESITNGAAEVSRSADDLSNRTESQAATLEQTAAALEEMTASVKSAADGAKSVEVAMAGARNEAENSGKVVQNAVSAMTEIEQSSTKISQIISVIDDIAFQTNLLALNAGVEAARAGEAGRGFAVVASEVRGLAQRSADAATEIKTLIEDSSRQVDHGVSLVGKTGEALGSIVGRVNEISKLITEIASGAAEQATGLGEINTGVVQLDRVTQQNAAMVEEATAAGHMLHSDAAKMASLVAQFSISGTVTTLSAAGSSPSLNVPEETINWDAGSDEPPLQMTGSNNWQDF